MMNLRTNSPNTATATVQALHSGMLNMRALLERQLETLSKYSWLNAVVETRPLRSLEKRVDNLQKLVDSTRFPGSLLGAPCTVKDTIAVKGLHLTAGSSVLSENMASIDAPVISRIESAGAWVVGKTNCPEFAFGIGTSNLLHGITYNPLDKSLSPGGSSGGEAASVAAGISMIGIGSDYGGSIRWPAQSVGILGLRPTPGRLPGLGQIVGAGSTGLDGNSSFPRSSAQSMLQVPGLLARSTKDLRAALFYSAGFLAHDPTSSPGPPISQNLCNINRVRVAWSDGTQIGPVDSQITEAIRLLAKKLAKIGVNITEERDAFVGLREAFDDLRSYDELHDIRSLIKNNENNVTEQIRTMVQTEPLDRSKYAKAFQKAISIRSKALTVLEHYPLFLLPVAGSAATGHDETAWIEDKKVSGFDLMAHCRAVSMIGAPVISIPISVTRNGLPISVQIIGQPWQENQVLSLAELIEDQGGGWNPEIMPT